MRKIEKTTENTQMQWKVSKVCRRFNKARKMVSRWNNIKSKKARQVWSNTKLQDDIQLYRKRNTKDKKYRLSAKSKEKKEQQDRKKK